jgi:hypothetical protein
MNELSIYMERWGETKVVCRFAIEQVRADSLLQYDKEYVFGFLE